jgi:vacuolar-type H+-ATPase subunit B/Vma2
VNAFIAKKEKMMLTHSQVKKLTLAEQLQYSAQLLKPVQKENLASVSQKVIEQQKLG